MRDMIDCATLEPLVSLLDSCGRAFPRKIYVFLWRGRLDAVPMRDMLHRRGRHLSGDITSVPGSLVSLIDICCTYGTCEDRIKLSRGFVSIVYYFIWRNMNILVFG